MFAAHDNERFYQCWERFMETISACAHHGFDTWMMVNHFYGGMSPAMKQLLETMCGGDFLSKHPDEAMEFLPIQCPPRRTLSKCSLSERFDVRACQCRGPIQATTQCPIW